MGTGETFDRRRQYENTVEGSMASCVSELSRLSPYGSGRRFAQEAQKHPILLNDRCSVWLQPCGEFDQETRAWGKTQPVKIAKHRRWLKLGIIIYELDPQPMLQRKVSEDSIWVMTRLSVGIFETKTPEIRGFHLGK